MTADSRSPAPEEKPEAKGIELDKHGDPVLQGTKMIERESYERVVEGLKMAADACAHIAFTCKSHGLVEEGVLWARRAMAIDKVRVAAVKCAGIEDNIRSHLTDEVRRGAMPFAVSRRRLNEGLMQAGGGMRQLATCFRMDGRWSAMATMTENMERNWRSPRRSALYMPH